MKILIGGVTLDQCHMVSLNAWDKGEQQQGKQYESLTKMTQS